jgi:hypothetical protein
MGVCFSDMPTADEKITEVGIIGLMYTITGPPQIPISPCSGSIVIYSRILVCYFQEQEWLLL